LGLVFAALPADWLDGPLARRVGPSAYGEVLDLETDSWLTLCSAAAAARWGGLPAYVVAPALARYPILIWGLRRSSYSRLNTGHPGWARPVGMAQMTLFIAALAPFGASFTRTAVRVAAPVITVAQLGTLAFLYGWRRP
jgi:phosphatidylglycerophosphate synthase